MCNRSNIVHGRNPSLAQLLLQSFSPLDVEHNFGLSWPRNLQPILHSLYIKGYVFDEFIQLTEETPCIWLMSL